MERSSACAAVPASWSTRDSIDCLGEGGEPWVLLSRVYSNQWPGLRQILGGAKP